MSLALFPLPFACSAGTAEPSRPISAGQRQTFTIWWSLWAWKSARLRCACP